MLNKLRQIQEKLKAPKDLYNSFGNYKYRNAETILEAFKPYETEYKVSLVLSDTIKEVSGRIYVEATATLYDCESDNSVSVTAFAREAENKKGMDPAQVTGATSSYARKYALNGLFLLDDTKDPDTDEYEKQSKGKTKSQQNSKADKDEPKTKNYTLDECMVLVKEKGYGNYEDGFCKIYKVNKLEDLNQEQLNDFFMRLCKLEEKKGS